MRPSETFPASDPLSTGTPGPSITRLHRSDQSVRALVVPSPLVLAVRVKVKVPSVSEVLARSRKDDPRSPQRDRRRPRPGCSSHQEMVREFSGPPSTIAADAAWSARAQPPRAGEPIIRNPEANCMSAFGSVTIGRSNRNVLDTTATPSLEASGRRLRPPSPGRRPSAPRSPAHPVPASLRRCRHQLPLRTEATPAEHLYVGSCPNDRPESLDWDLTNHVVVTSPDTLRRGCHNRMGCQGGPVPIHGSSRLGLPGRMSMGPDEPAVPSDYRAPAVGGPLAAAGMVGRWCRGPTMGAVGSCRSVSKLLAEVSNGEHAAAPRPSAVVREAERRLAGVVDEVARRQRIDRRTFLRSRTAPRPRSWCWRRAPTRSDGPRAHEHVGRHRAARHLRRPAVGRDRSRGGDDDVGAVARRGDDRRRTDALPRP